MTNVARWQMVVKAEALLPSKIGRRCTLGVCLCSGFEITEVKTSWHLKNGIFGSYMVGSQSVIIETREFGRKVYLFIYLHFVHKSGQSFAYLCVV